ncbi:MAG: 2'-5' RNA ligase family protein [Actinomycetia bacterium]|nr:2'-5' RNA ligase family protein [Actinomycetes bacterium]
MSLGVVLWPDLDTEGLVREIWTDLADHRLLSAVSGAPHGHRPHVSLVVADEMDIDAALTDVGHVPTDPIDVLIESFAVVKAGHLLLNITPTAQLLREQARVHSLVVAHAASPSPHYAPDRWLPHMTLARSLTPTQLSEATPMVTARLPIGCVLTTGGIEDGTTGDRWESTLRRAGSPHLDRGESRSPTPDQIRQL